MAKGKVNVQICTQDLSPEQLTQLPLDVWSFLVDELGGHVSNVQKMRSPKIKSAALAFIDSEVGKSYWPHSEMGDLQCEASFPELEAYIAHLMMARQNGKQPEEDNSFLNDFDIELTPPPPKVSKAPWTPNDPKHSNQPPSGQSKLSFASAKKSPALSTSAVKREAASKSKSFSQESYNGTDSLDRCPDDTQFEMESNFPVTPKPKPKPKRSLQTPVSNRRTNLEERRKANGTASVHSPQEVGDTIEAVPTHSEDSEATRGTGLKRRSADANDSRQHTPTPQIPHQPSHKRARRTEPESSANPLYHDNEHEVEVDTTSFTVVDSEPSVRPSVSPRPSSVIPSAQPDTEATIRPGNNALFRALGGEFTADNIAKVGDVFLDYIEDCEQEYHRTAARINDPDAKGHNLFCARNLGDLRQDLQNIAKTLMIDAAQRNRMRTDYTLKKASGENI